MAVVLETRGTAIAALVRSYMQRREVGVSEAARRIGRDPSAVSKIVTGQSLGIRPLRRGDVPTLALLRRELRIPARELDRALRSDQQHLRM